MTEPRAGQIVTLLELACWFWGWGYDELDHMFHGFNKGAVGIAVGAPSEFNDRITIVAARAEKGTCNGLGAIRRTNVQGPWSHLFRSVLIVDPKKLARCRDRHRAKWALRRTLESGSTDAAFPWNGGMPKP